MSNDAVNIAIPTHAFDFNALVGFTKNAYHFANPTLKTEFEEMFEMSFESQFKTTEFLTELVRLLEHFSEQHPEHVH
jgi:hypothetical protein